MAHVLCIYICILSRNKGSSRVFQINTRNGDGSGPQLERSEGIHQLPSDIAG